MSRKTVLQSPRIRNSIVRPGAKKPQRIKVINEKWGKGKLKRIQFDDYCRPFGLRWGRAIRDGLAQKYEPDTFAHTVTAIIVSQRSDGTYWGMSGRHRCWSLIDLDLICQVTIHQGLTYEEEVEFYNVQQLSKTEPTWNFFDNSARINSTIATVRDFFDKNVPGWNTSERKVPIQRMGWVSAIQVIQGKVKSQTRKEIENTAKTFLPQWQTYLEQILDMIKEMFPWEEAYGLSNIHGKANEMPLVWRHQYVLLGTILTITQFHKKFGNCDKTNDMIYDLFLMDDIVEKSLEETNKIERGIQRLTYFSGFCIERWNRKSHVSRKVPHPLGHKFIQWKSVSSKVHKLSNENDYYICQDM